MFYMMDGAKSYIISTTSKRTNKRHKDSYQSGRKYEDITHKHQDTTVLMLPTKRYSSSAIPGCAEYRLVTWKERF